MAFGRSLEQHIAVFGASGSGKTVLLSSFYGATQEPAFLRQSLFNVVADDIGQGHRLHRNYLGMRDSSTAPSVTRFRGSASSFSLRFKQADPKARHFDAVRLVWHDYPGEWFENDVSGPEEERRRVETFRLLLQSDVALLLVDGDRLREHAGDEGRYLRELFTMFRTGLLTLKDQLLEDGKPLVRFPRIWMMALSKADLLPAMDVFAFRDLLVSEAAEDIDALRHVLMGFVEASEVMSVGEDIVRLSSARFESSRIEVTERVGLDLVLPIAAILPFERHARWAQAGVLPRRVAEDLLTRAGDVASTLVLLSKFKLPGPAGLVVGVVGGLLSKKVVEDAAAMAIERIKEANARALARKDFLAAALGRFRLDLVKGEDEGVLLRSRR